MATASTMHFWSRAQVRAAVLVLLLVSRGNAYADANAYQRTKVAFVEYRAEDANVPIKALHKMSEAQIKREAAPHQIEWERTSNVLPWQHIVIFKKKG